MAAKSKSKAKSKAKKAKAKTIGRKPAKARASKEKGWRIACQSLAEIRQNIDRLDDLIAPLLSQRLYFVKQAANFKPSVAGVVVPSRVEEIIARVRTVAASMDSSPDTLERVYRSLIDAFTADEQRHWKELHK